MTDKNAKCDAPLHTPGPWIVNPRGAIPMVGIDPEDGLPLLPIVDVVYGPDEAQCIANARLIAAAQRADMFWNAEDPERCYRTLHDAVVETASNETLSVGDVVELQQAIQLPNIRVRITSVDDDAGGELSYEVLGGEVEA